MYEWSDAHAKLIYVSKNKKFDKETESALRNSERDKRKI